VLETYAELSLGPYAQTQVARATSHPTEKIAEALKDVLRESKTTTKTCGIAIPFGSSLISLIEMPALSPKQLAPMIPIEARKYIPVPIGEVTLDWWVIPKQEKTVDLEEEKDSGADKKEKIEVLLVAIHNDTINKFQQIIREAQVQASFFEIEIFSALRSVIDQEAGAHVLFDMGAGSTKIYLVEQGNVRSTHIVNRGSQDLTLAISQSLGVSVEQAEIMKRNHRVKPSEHEKNISDLTNLTYEYIFSQVNRVMLTYQKKFGKNIKKAILVGGGVKLGGFYELAKKGLETEVVMGDPFSKTDPPAFLEELLRTTGPEFAVAVGVALRRLQEME
jgi:type IV pilus assembly protein PilM